MTLHAPQIIYLLIAIIHLMLTLAHHNRPMVGRHSIWAMSVFHAIIGVLLYWGGFFG